MFFPTDIDLKKNWTLGNLPGSQADATGPVRELNPGHLAPEARIIPLDQQATPPVV